MFSSLRERTRRSSLVMVMLAAGLAVLLAHVVDGADGQSSLGKRSVEADAQTIFERVLSPYCPGILLSACTSSAAEVLRSEVRASLRAGEPIASVEADLYRRFGDGISTEPPMNGTGMFIWFAPLLLLAGSGSWLMLTVRRWSSAGRSASDTPETRAASAFDEALRTRLEAELDAL